MAFSYRRLEELLTDEGVKRWKEELSTDFIIDDESNRTISDVEYVSDKFMKSSRMWFKCQGILAKLDCTTSNVPHPMLRFIIWKLGIKIPAAAVGVKNLPVGFRYICARCTGGMHNDAMSVVCYNCKECSVGWEQRP